MAISTADKEKLMNLGGSMALVQETLQRFKEEVTPTMGASGPSHKGGLVPDPGATAGTSKYLCEDGTWAKPAYGEIGYGVATQTTSGAVTVDGTTPLHIITLSGAATSVAFSTGYLPAVGHSCHIIFTASTATTVSIAHVTTGAVRYICPEGSSPSDIDVPAGGYAEIDLLRGADTEENNDTVAWIYVRGI